MCQHQQNFAGNMLLSSMENGWKHIFLFCIRFYQVFLSPKFGGQCKFVPSCSVYAAQCFENWPWWRAAVLSAIRVVKCHPLRKLTWDPVPSQPGERQRLNN